MRKLLLALLLLPSFAFAIDYEANVKALSPSAWWKGYYGNTVDLTTLGASSLRDFSNNSRTFTQAVAANQAVATRQDNRENLVRGSNDERLAFYWTSGARFSWTGYTTSPTGVANSASIFVEDNTNGAHYAYPTTPTYDISYVGGQQYRVGYYVKTITGSRNWSLRFPDGIRTLWNSATCTFISKTESAGIVNSTSCTSAGSGWYYIEMVVTPTASGTGSIYFYPYDNLTVNYLGDGVSSQAIWGPRIQAVAADTNYLIPGPVSCYRGVSGLPALHFDGVNDYFSQADFLTTGNMTLYVSHRPASMGGGSLGRILDNGKFVLSIHTNNNGYAVQCDGINTYSGTNTYVANVPVIYALTRTNGGVANHYINNVLSGTANQNCGVPVAGTTNLFLGDNNGHTRMYNGDITEIILFNAIHNSTQMQTVYDYLSWTLNNPWKRIEVTP